MLIEIFTAPIQAVREHIAEQRRAHLLLENIEKSEQLLAESRRARINDRPVPRYLVALFAQEISSLQLTLASRYQKLPEGEIDPKQLPHPRHVVSSVFSQTKVMAERLGIVQERTINGI